MNRIPFDYDYLDHKIYTHYVKIELDAGLFTKNEDEFISKAYGWVSSKTGIPMNRLQRIMNNQVYFNEKEISKVCDALDIPFDFIPVFFFTEHDPKKEIRKYNFCVRQSNRINSVQGNIINVSFA